MARKVRTHLIDTPEPATMPEHLTKQQFGRRLFSLMMAKGWRQSELARQADLPRDSISTYVRGRSLPTPHNLARLSKALGVKPEALLPNHVESAIDNDNPSFEMRASPNAPNVVWLRVNRAVSLSTAVKIAELIQGDETK